MSVANVVTFCALVILWLSCEVEVAVCDSEGEIVRFMSPHSGVKEELKGGRRGVPTFFYFAFHTRERVRLGREEDS